jgi:hypothetical protein
MALKNPLNEYGVKLKVASAEVLRNQSFAMAQCEMKSD